MSDRSDPSAAQNLPDDTALRTLLELAGPRPAAPPQVRAQVRGVAHAAWREKAAQVAAQRRHQRRRRQRAVATWAIAALVLLTVGVGVWTRLGVLAPTADAVLAQRVATVERIVGEAWSGEVRVTGGMVLEDGAELRTGADGRVALRLESGVALRLDGSTRLRLPSAASVELEAGAVYLDTDDPNPRTPDTSRAVEVHTAYGTARDIGTRFEVRVADETLEVRVRDGLVEVDTGALVHPADAGTLLTVTASGEVASSPLTTADPAWDWTVAVAPPFTLEGRSVAEALEWAARENGWKIRWTDDALAREASASRIHGSGQTRDDVLDPRVVPDLVLPVAGWTSHLEGDVLVIERMAP